MIPTVADSEEDPTTQIPWPARRKNANSTLGDVVDDDSDVQEQEDAVDDHPNIPSVSKKPLTTWDLITLSISMAGAQIAWTVELGYGTPFLLGLGISEQVTSLVWLAGPISGLIAQPVIGAVSDSSTSKYRRRYWIITSTLVLVFVTLLLAYCESLAKVLVDLFGVGAGDWDEKRNARAKDVAIAIAVISFYLLDFALNALQASLRNLLLDIAPAGQLNAGNAWHGRMTNAGNIIGFGFGFFPLATLPVLRLVGGTQFRKFCIICIIILAVTVAITCYCHEEEERPRQENNSQSKFQEVVGNIREAIIHLPQPIRRVCYVQLFAFMGWFPFLFYATTYMGQVMANELGKEPDAELATRTGELAMLFYSIVAVIAGIVLPHMASRDRRLMAHKEDVNEEAETARLETIVRHWKDSAPGLGKRFRLPRSPFLLRNIWMAAMLLFSVLTLSTFFIHTVALATCFISLVGICWAVAMWAPFAIIMELLKEMQQPTVTKRPTENGNSLRRSGEQQPLLSRIETGQPQTPAKPIAGGTVLGIHNLAIVLPQLIVAIVTSMIFRMVDGHLDEDPTNDDTYYGRNGVAWVLRFGGACTLIGAALALRIPPTPTEKAIRRRYNTLRKLVAQEHI